MKTFFGGQKSSPAAPPSAQDGTAPGLVLGNVLPRLPRGSPMDIYMFIAEDDEWSRVAHSQQPVWALTDFELGSGDPVTTSIKYHPSTTVQQNGTVWFHSVFTPSGASPDPADGFFDPAFTFAKSEPLVVYLPKPKVKGE